MRRQSWYKRPRAVWPWVIATSLAFAYLPFLRWQIARDPFHSQLYAFVNIARCLGVLALLAIVMSAFKTARQSAISLLLGLCIFGCVSCMLLPATFGLRIQWQADALANYLTEYEVVIEAISNFRADTGRLPNSLAELRPDHLGSSFPRPQHLSYIAEPQRDNLRVPEWSVGKDYLLILQVYSGGFLEEVALYYYVPDEGYPAELDRVGVWATRDAP